MNVSRAAAVVPVRSRFVEVTLCGVTARTIGWLPRPVERKPMRTLLLAIQMMAGQCLTHAFPTVTANCLICDDAGYLCLQWHTPKGTLSGRSILRFRLDDWLGVFADGFELRARWRFIPDLRTRPRCHRPWFRPKIRLTLDEVLQLVWASRGKPLKPIPDLRAWVHEGEDR